MDNIDFIDDYNEKMEILRPFYERYTKGPDAISTDGMAISLETATFMYQLCHMYRFETLMDRGSGFSSFVLRKYAEDRHFSVDVYSIDDSKEWLDKTREFLEENYLNTDNLMLWDDFYKSYKNSIEFDFILEDAKKKLRVDTPNKLTSFIEYYGIILWDDALPHNGLLTNQCEKLNMKKYNVKKYTFDSYGRYATLTTRRKLVDFEKI